MSGIRDESGHTDSRRKTRLGPVALLASRFAMNALEAFHPAVRTWFERRFPEGPTEPQQRGWPTIAEGRDTLIAAPTGTGKTLSAFLVCIDRLFRAWPASSNAFVLYRDGAVVSEYEPSSLDPAALRSPGPV